MTSSIDRMEAPEGKEWVAGREIDAEIAEKVMGFVWKRAPRRDLPQPAKGLIPPDELWAWSELRGDEIVAADYARFCLHYSTRIADAWLVVEKMRERGFDISIAVEEKGITVIVLVADTEYVAWLGEPVATAPLAICRAAIDALAHAHSNTPPTEGQPT